MQMRLQYTVIGLQGKNCLCGNAYPPKDSLVEDEKCNYPCPAFGMEACGSIGNPKHYTVFNLGIDIDVPYADPDAASSTPSSTHSSTPVETPSGSGTLIGSPKPTESDDNSSAGFNLAKITATVFGLAAAVAGVACL